MTPFVRPRPVDRPALRLIGFHHAGGSSTAYYPMGRAIPDDWELLLLDLPGRAKRYHEPPMEHIDDVVDLALADVEPWLDVPVALFGHSYGAIVATEVARKLCDTGRPPLWTGVSGRVSPGYRTQRRLSELDDLGLLQQIRAMGGLPEQLDEVPEFVARFTRLTRADLRSVESYRPPADRTPLSCPLTVFCGTDDLWAPPAAMSGWSAESVHEVRRRVFPGGHFYFLGSSFAGFTRELVAEIEAAAAPVMVNG
ncbi:alpha/beta fold hydrolase [Streptomyces sp. NPDC002588]|uniref:thioesterase II family protein n=1 Tax=Streptomyces sp. NPDC002588 TaxID=3154419 RepID=UPI00331CCBEB